MPSSPCSGRLSAAGSTARRPKQQLKTIDTLIGEDADTIREQCEAHLAYAGNNYLPFLLPLFRNHRKTLSWISWRFCSRPRPVRTRPWSRPLPLSCAIVMREAARLPIIEDGPEPRHTLDISWVPPRWWKAVTGSHRRDVPILTVDRKYLELCVLPV